MKTDKKTIVIFLSIIIVLATVAFSFESFTGQAGRLWVLEESMKSQPKGEGSVTVEPAVIMAGEKIQITIKPGDICIDNEIQIYKEGRVRKIIEFKKSAQQEGGYTGVAKYCEEATIQYKTWNSWTEGDYYVQVRELPMKTTGKVESRTTYYTDDFKIKETKNYPKIIFSKIGSFISNPRTIFGQRYVFEN